MRERTRKTREKRKVDERPVEESVVAMKGTTTENEDTEEPNAENKKLQFVYDKLSHELCKKLEESCFGIRFLPITESGIFRYSLSAHH
ncbi:unnamed protein product [Toxocara canis]|uniref:Uncharacterized protein n=1 Tax=Toxocara canis TaxID=6265 RepID=A0A183V7F7_TOXCA|nr:unnamed protein product [Toxocara canis]